ncbi:MAG: NAD-dependent epimerase/dehydratase family protein [Candidatus Rokubacteria bacterium]|nr:NAD-dependent epimerase/dehydratase family protein [Candidatus Rokubacteria bacterium]
MKVLVLGGDGYLGWPTALHFSARGHEVAIFDNLCKRQLEARVGVQPLFPVQLLQQRVKTWVALTRLDIPLFVGDLLNHRAVYHVMESFVPDAIVHYAEQPSAPYSMRGRDEAVFTQHNNVVGTLNLLFAMKRFAPAAHLVKLGTMGEYGTPNIDIEEGFIEIAHKGRSDVLPFPKLPGSFYHLSKVHDSHNIMFSCRVWGLRATDLNQGVVYGIDTDETRRDPRLVTSFHYDELFGTVLNRFCVQAVVGLPLTVYGEGGQTRGFLNLVDTLQCVELSVLNPAAAGEFRVFNQFTETFSVLDLATKVQTAAAAIGLGNVGIQHVKNPRIEAERHYYNPAHTKLAALGLKPHLLSEVLIDDVLRRVKDAKQDILLDTIQPRTPWRRE